MSVPPRYIRTLKKIINTTNSDELMYTVPPPDTFIAFNKEATTTHDIDVDFWISGYELRLGRVYEVVGAENTLDPSFYFDEHGNPIPIYVNGIYMYNQTEYNGKPVYVNQDGHGYMIVYHEGEWNIVPDLGILEMQSGYYYKTGNSSINDYGISGEYVNNSMISDSNAYIMPNYQWWYKHIYGRLPVDGCIAFKESMDSGVTKNIYSIMSNAQIENVKERFEPGVQIYVNGVKSSVATIVGILYDEWMVPIIDEEIPDFSSSSSESPNPESSSSGSPDPYNSSSSGSSDSPIPPLPDESSSSGSPIIPDDSSSSGSPIPDDSSSSGSPIPPDESSSSESSGSGGESIIYPSPLRIVDPDHLSPQPSGLIMNNQVIYHQESETYWAPNHEYGIETYEHRWNNYNCSLGDLIGYEDPEEYDPYRVILLFYAPDEHKWVLNSFYWFIEPVEADRIMQSDYVTVQYTWAKSEEITMTNGVPSKMPTEVNWYIERTVNGEGTGVYDVLNEHMYLEEYNESIDV